MARYCGTDDATVILNAAENWRDTCLINRRSIFDGEEIWSLENVNQLMRYFVNNLDFSGNNFLTKLEDQLSPTTNEAKQLAAEMMWVMLLCPSNISPEKKRENISTILSWAGKRLDPGNPFLADAVLRGAGSAGTAYNNLRWKELVYFIRLLYLLFSLSDVDRRELISDGNKFSMWLEGVEDNENRQLRHMLLFLLFPNDHERIFGTSDRKTIAAAFSGQKVSAYKRFTANQLDHELNALRSRLEAEFNTKQLDWYVPPLRAMWLNTSKNGSTVNDAITPILRRFIEQAKTSDLATRHYPAKHSGLEMRVSFGAGNQAHVPWIGFLAPGQTPTKGIYPVYLYYKEDKLLILAKGVSSTNKPEDKWQGEDLVTIEDYFIEEFNKKPIRYGESYIYKTYDLNKDLDEDMVEHDLADLLSEYKELAGLLKVQEPEEPYSTEPSNKNETLLASDEKMSFDEAVKGVFLSREKIEEIIDLLRAKKNIVLQGPPGVGKTFISKRIAYALMGSKAKNRYELIQFHQNYSYEDFIQGYRPSDAGFELKNGIFHQFCDRALKEPEKQFVFIVDEINRGNLSKIFGELMMLIEADKRGIEWRIPLTYSKDLSETFYVPENVYLIGLMNTADRSLSLVDYALRRRFAFIDLDPEFNSEAFTRHLSEAGATEGMVSKIISRLNSLNERIATDTANLGPGFRVGHSFFCANQNTGNYDDYWYSQVIKYEIAPLLSEYWFDDPKTVELVINELLA